MAAFNYIVHSYLSPRIMEVLTAKDITVQQIIDACREWEDTVVGLSYPYLIDAAGKEELGGGVTVGITATLKNTQIMFTTRSTPLDDGSGRTCDANDTTGKQLYVDDANFVADGVAVGDTVFNKTTGAMAAITEVVDLHTLNHFELSGGSNADWTSGNEYIIYNNEECSVTGGNLVAVDDSDVAMSAFMPSPNVYLRTTSSSSATLQEIEDIQYALFADAVWDETLGDHTTVGTYGEELVTKADIASNSSTVQISAISGTVVYGTETGGTYASTLSKDNAYWQITEDNSDGITVEMVFNITDSDCRPGTFNVFGRYEGTPPVTHHQELWVYNYETDSWEELIDVFLPGGNTSDASYSHEYYERHIDRTNNGEVKIRIIHHVTTYNNSHNLYIDYADISCIEVITAEEIATAVWAGSGGTQVDELHKLQGLDTSNAMTVTPTSRTVGSIAQVISGDGETTTTVTRTP